MSFYSIYPVFLQTNQIMLFMYRKDGQADLDNINFTLEVTDYMYKRYYGPYHVQMGFQPHVPFDPWEILVGMYNSTVCVAA